MAETKKENIKRCQEITARYFAFLDRHIDDVIHAQVDNFLELNQIAKALHISHSHLSDTVQQTTGHHPCHFYDLKIIEKSKSILMNTDMSVAAIALKLTYDPSNFSKFFKKFVGKTPGQFRKENKK